MSGLNDVIIFYEKPGCLSNRKQKALLRSAGFHLSVKNLLEHSWQAEELASYFSDLPVAEWFNPAAPQIKSGAIDPARLDRTAALRCLLDDPLLIRRPLLANSKRRMAGFDSRRIREMLGIELKDSQGRDADSLASCSREIAHDSRSCS